MTEVVQNESTTLEANDPIRRVSEELLAKAVQARATGLQQASLGQPSDPATDSRLSGEARDTRHVSNAVVVHDSSILAHPESQP